MENAPIMFGLMALLPILMIVAAIISFFSRSLHSEI